MSTRGAYGFRLNGTDFITYNHSDSYPSGLGVDILKQTKDLVRAKGGIASLTQKVAAVRLIQPGAVPTAQDIARCAAYTDLNVSEQSTSDWYCLLRNAQGSLPAILETGLIRDGTKFLADSLFCEYAGFNEARFENGKAVPKSHKGRYASLMDLDDEARVVEAARTGGFQNGSHAYFGVALVQAFPLRKLPSETVFLKKVDKE